MSELTLNASSVASVAQGVLTFALAGVLRRGARTAARRRLARALIWLTVYSVAIFVTFSAVREELDNSSSVVALLAGMMATLDLVSYAGWLDEGADPDGRLTLSRPLWAFAALALSATVVGILAAWSNRLAIVRAASMSINLMLLGLFTLMFVRLRSAWRRRVAGAKSLARAAAWPVVAICANLVASAAIQAGLAVPVGLYQAIRDVALLFFAFGILTTYLDHGHEPMSLHARLVAGTLTVVAVLVTASAHLFEAYLGGKLGPSLAPEVGDGIAWRLLLLLALGAALVFGLLPRIFRRSVLEPLDALIGAVETVERGEIATLPAERADELGRLSKSFNAMSRGLADGRRALEEKVTQLETRQREIESLNEELRRQIASRSRSLAESLERGALGRKPALPEDQIGERYRVIHRLGEGGMGVVYEVERTTDERRFALKMLAPSATPTTAVRLAREAEIAASVSHANLVSVVDVGVHDGSVYLVMELVEGGSLDDARSRFGDLDFARAVLPQIARGLVALHESGVVHRDLKPANVLVTEKDGVVMAKIADFGISRRDQVDVLGATAAMLGPTAPVASGLTKTGSMMGTVAYMAPELASGASGVKAPADVFAFGVLAYEVLVGKYPFVMPPILLVMSGQAFPAPLPLPDSLPAEMREVVSLALDEEPARRPTAARIAELLASAAPRSPER